MKNLLKIEGKEKRCDKKPEKLVTPSGSQPAVGCQPGLRSHFFTYYIPAFIDYIKYSCSLGS